MNRFMESDPFLLSDESQFNYTVQYGVSDSLNAISTLGAHGRINLRMELIDDATGNVIGVHDNVTISSSRINTFVSENHAVSNKGIGSKMVRLRLAIQDNIEPVYVITNIFAMTKVFLNKSISQTAINYDGKPVVTDYDLSQNYPNPFNPSTTISFQVPVEGVVSLKVFDILGKEVATLVNDHRPAGRYDVSFDASRLSSGVYVYELRTFEGLTPHVLSKKMTLLK